MSRKPVALQVGDIVQERTNLRMSFGRAEARKDAKVLGTCRTGVITGIETRAIRRGRKLTYLHVIWEGCKTPSLHSRNRVELLDNANKQAVS